MSQGNAINKFHLILIVNNGLFFIKKFPVLLLSFFPLPKDIRKYMCDVCGKRFRSQSHMTYHRYAHFEARNFACDQCTQRFKSPHILRTHKNTVHSTVFRYECETCGRKFKRDHHLVVSKKCRFGDTIFLNA